MNSNYAEKVFTFTEEKGLIQAPCRVLLGLSGGADSMALLHMLIHWPVKGIEVQAVHIHHGLRGDAADRDESFVRSVCCAYNVPLFTERVDVAQMAAVQHRTVEEMGRVVRYALFEKIREEINADFILTAHTASDQAETVLMRILRGTGIDGLCGIPALRGRICRPLLPLSRTEIEAYCAENAIAYICDETNEDVKYTRNRIRNELLPLLRQYNTSVDEALLRLSHHADEDSAFLNELALKAISESDGKVSVLRNQPLPIRRRCILQILANAAVPTVEQTHVLAVEGILQNGNGRVSLPGRRIAQIVGDRLMINEINDILQPQESMVLESLPYEGSYGNYDFCLAINDAPIVNVHKLFFINQIDYDTIQGSLHIRTRRVGDRMRPSGRGLSKSLKKLMNEWQIPSQYRDAYPLLCDDVGIVMIPGYGCDERVRVTEDTKHFLVWQTKNEQG